MVLAGFAGAVVLTDDASAESVSTASIDLSDDVVATESEVTATLHFEEQDTSIFSSVRFEAKLVDSDGSTQSSALSTSSGTGTSVPYTREITVTLPEEAGRYTLQVTFTESFSNDDDDKVINVSRVIDVREPITLSITVANNGSLAVTDATVYFYVDGQRIDDSEQTLTVEADGTKTVTYDFFDKNLSSGKHTYSLQAGDSAYTIEGLGTEYSFYYDQDSLDYMTYIIVFILIILIIFAIWVFRKPVKNYGKPKARR